MNKNIHMLILGLFLLMCGSQSFAYRYTFSNHTSYPMLIGIKLCCAFEDLVVKKVKPDRMATFIHGKDFPNVKFGYCLQSISYVKNPTLKNKVKPETAPWTEINTTWEKTAIYDTIIEFAETVGEGTEVAGKAAVKIAAASMTGGASAAAEGAAKGAEAAASATTKAMDVAKKIITTSETNSGSQKSSGLLGKFSKGLAKLVSITTCRDRHWDIYENEDGTPNFVSKVQQ